MRVVAILPALNEAATLPAVLAAIAPDLVWRVVVVDGGSSDGTPVLAQQAGAQVVTERQRGYGRACLAGAAEAQRLGAEVLAFLDASGSADPADLPAILAPILQGQADLALGSRTMGHAEPGALRPLQRLGNALAVSLIRLRHGKKYSDLGSMRAITSSALGALAMRELAHGWPAEMQVKAARVGLRVVEVPMRYRRRPAGRSKVSGTWSGAVRAGAAILRVVLTS